MSEPTSARKSLLLGAVIAASLVIAGGAPLGAAAPDANTPLVSTPAEDEVSIRNLQTDQSTAWNEHDATGYARLFADDGEVVTLMGWWWKGRKQIQEKVAGAFDATYRDSVLTVTDISVRLLSSSIAVAHVRWTMTGSKMPAGMPEPKAGIQIQVLQKKAGAWVIQSMQNTSSYPERRFPRSVSPGRRS